MAKRNSAVQILFQEQLDLVSSPRGSQNTLERGEKRRSFVSYDGLTVVVSNLILFFFFSLSFLSEIFSKKIGPL